MAADSIAFDTRRYASCLASVAADKTRITGESRMSVVIEPLPTWVDALTCKGREVEEFSALARLPFGGSARVCDSYTSVATPMAGLLAYTFRRGGVDDEVIYTCSRRDVPNKKRYYPVFSSLVISE